MTHRTRRLLWISTGLILSVTAAALSAGQDAPPPRTTAAVTTSDLLRWVKEFSNAGRWSNQLGAANFITELKRFKAARLVQEGLPISLAHPVLKVPFDPLQPFLPATPSIAPLPTVPLSIPITATRFFTG